MDVMSAYAFTYPSNVPSWLMTLLSVNTVAVIAMHCLAFIIGTWLSPYMHATTKEYHPPSEGPLEKVPNFLPHARFKGYIRLSHRISHVGGLFVFLVEIVLIAWVKFWDVSLKACVASTVIMLPFMMAFVFFWWYFHFSYNTQIYLNRIEVIDNVELLYNQMKRDACTYACSNENLDQISNRRISTAGDSYNCTRRRSLPTKYPSM
ncbi:protein orai-2-like [Neocloeon triangulifer]|uniref:protein orai-2-like n=1 Tax=Neocloeon triangulifer TaxID=2078957 RepID=UPI00286EE623|nr:protein orai-2-like [Neocloeon triangulifer]